MTYRGVHGATVVNTMHRLPGSYLTTDALDEIRRETQSCIDLDEGPPRMKILELGTDRFGYETFKKSGKQTGSIGFAFADRSYVSVAVIKDDADTGQQMASLLDTAVARADAAAPPQ